MSKHTSIQSLIIYGVFIIYILFLLKLLLLSRVSFEELFHGERSLFRDINLVPFRGIVEYMIGEEADVRRFAFGNVAGNIGVFIPLGFYLSLFKGRNRVMPVLWIIFMASSLVEMVQGVFGLGTADVDDIILNCLGGWMGILGYKFLVFALREEKKVRTAVAIISALGLPILLFLLFMVRLRL